MVGANAVALLCQMTVYAAVVSPAGISVPTPPLSVSSPAGSQFYLSKFGRCFRPYFKYRRLPPNYVYKQRTAFTHNPIDLACLTEDTLNILSISILEYSCFFRYKLKKAYMMMECLANFYCFILECKKHL